MVNSGNSALYFGTETDYGTVATIDKKMPFSSADFKLNINKKSDGLITGGKTSGKVETMSRKVDGSFSTMAKPTFTGYILKGLLGVEGAVSKAEGETKTTHTFTAMGNTESDKMPSYDFVLDRLVSKQVYNGCEFDSADFSAQAEDYLSISSTLVGKDEATYTGTINTPETDKELSLKFRQGKVYIGTDELADVTSIKLSYKNNLSGIFTTSTGLYQTKPEVGSRAITAEIEVVYSSKSEAVRKSYFTDSDNTFAIKLQFADENSNTLTIDLPAVQITSADLPQLSGSDTLKQSISMTAVDSDSELITATLKNDKAVAY